MQTLKLDKNAEMFFASRRHDGSVVHVRDTFQTPGISVDFHIVKLRRGKKMMIFDTPRGVYPVSEYGSPRELRILKDVIAQVAASKKMAFDLRIEDPVYRQFKKWAALKQTLRK